MIRPSDSWSASTFSPGPTPRCLSSSCLSVTCPFAVIVSFVMDESSQPSVRHLCLTVKVARIFSHLFVPFQSSHASSASSVTSKTMVPMLGLSRNTPKGFVLRSHRVKARSLLLWFFERRQSALAHTILIASAWRVARNSSQHISFFGKSTDSCGSSLTLWAV